MVPQHKLNVAEILRAPTGALVRKKRRTTDDGNAHAVDLYVGPLPPRILERDSVDRGYHVDAPRNDPHLKDQVVTRKIINADLIERCAELGQSSMDTPSVFDVMSNPNVKVTGSARLRVNGQRVRADEKKPNSARDEFAQQIAEV
ncbi:MAG: hypothetical protein JO083_05935 [Candidatus Eremiobacteraeota bacterium]|nr:hypothetical protein [Candidatus Eremiobacteraeota bacterium]